MIENNKFHILLKVLLWLAPIIIGFSLAIGSYREKQNALSEKTDATNIRLNAVESLSMANFTAITVLQKDIQYIKETCIRIESSINNKK